MMKNAGIIGGLTIASFFLSLPAYASAENPLAEDLGTVGAVVEGTVGTITFGGGQLEGTTFDGLGRTLGTVGEIVHPR